MHLTTTRLQCETHLPEEACINRQDHRLMGGGDPWLVVVTLPISRYPLRDRE